MTVENRSIIGGRVVALRKRLGMSQRKLAKRSGVSQATLSRLENGERTPTIPDLLKLARALGCAYSELSAESPVRDRLVRFARTVTGGNTSPGALTHQLEHFFELDAYLDEQAIPR